MNTKNVFGAMTSSVLFQIVLMDIKVFVSVIYWLALFKAVVEWQE